MPDIFGQRKHPLATNLILRITDREKGFFICTYTCQKGVGGVLMQEGRVVAYECHKLK